MSIPGFVGVGDAVLGAGEWADRPSLAGLIRFIEWRWICCDLKLSPFGVDGFL